MTSLHFASRVGQIQPFLAMEVMERAFELARAGARVLHLEIGEPDLPPPPPAVAACTRALEAGETGYTDSRGLPELRAAIAADCSRRLGRSVPAERVLVTNGTSPAMLLVFSLLVDPGDEVVLGAPHYPCYPSFVRYCGGTPIFVRTRAEDGYRLDPDAVRASLSPRTRAIIVGSPANPTGAVQDVATLRALAALGPPLISDEIYQGLVYDAARAPSALDVSDDAFVLDGFSKRYAMTGFRLGHVIAPAEALRPLQVLQQNLFISPNHFVQRAGIAALERGGDTVTLMREAYARRRALLVDGLRALGLKIAVTPPGAFYVFADARAFARDSRKLAFELLERAHVACCPGIDFGEAGEGFLRFCYARPETELEEALARLARALPELR